jgi:hypothetical protein
VFAVAIPLLPSLSVWLPSRREEELRAELNFATCRVEELKRTLQETKSFLGPRLPTRGRDSAPMTAKGREGELSTAVVPQVWACSILLRTR